MIWPAYFIFAFLVLRFLVSLSSLLTRQWLKKVPPAGNTFFPSNGRYQSHSHSSRANDPPHHTPVRNHNREHVTHPEKPGYQPLPPPLISVLIPAREEEKNIGNLLNDLLKQDYENFEILVYDDLSEDNTVRIVCEIMNKDSRVSLVEGNPLPDDWLGKNHACQQLALAAKGEFLLFLDADVRVKPSLIRSTLTHMQRYRLDLFSLFPQQVMHTFGEKITVPVMNWVLAGLLPLIMTRISSWPSFSAANGQFMLFRADVYHRYKFHKKVRHKMVEDIEIFRLMKKKGLPAHTVLSNGDITCRMYDSWGGAITGFSKNVLEYFGGHTTLAVLFALVTSLGFIPVLLHLSWQLSLAFFILLALHRINISYLSRQPVLQNLLLAPLQQISFCVMLVTAIRHKRKNTLIWKGRDVYLHDAKTQVS